MLVASNVNLGSVIVQSRRCHQLLVRAAETPQAHTLHGVKLQPCEMEQIDLHLLVMSIIPKTVQATHGTLQEQALQKARAEAEVGSLAATTSALRQMCLQLHATAADNAAAAKAAETQVQSVAATIQLLGATIAMYNHQTCCTCFAS